MRATSVNFLRRFSFRSRAAASSQPIIVSLRRPAERREGFESVGDGMFNQISSLHSLGFFAHLGLISKSFE